ncbi:MAG TPA: AraC family transcriptional regulator [Burkholderiales bacterium]|nr:AraC family transcriptional regulator [Burkholderiales bacterium]
MSARQEPPGLNLPYRPAEVGDGMLRVGVLAELPPVLRRLGHDHERVLRDLDLPSDFLDDPERTLPFRLAGVLVERCARLTGCPHIGLLVGQRGGLDTVGVVGLLARHTPDVGSALRCIVQYLHLHDRGGCPTLAVEGASATLGYAIFGRDVPASDQVYAGGIAVACAMMRELCGAEWNPAEVQLPFRRPADIAPYKAYFRAPLRFGADHSALAFPAKSLDEPLAGADPKICAAMEAFIAGFAAARKNEVAGQVRRTVLALLMSGKVAEPEVARVFAIHHRTLGRRLQTEGTTFQRILGEVRYDVACQLLRDTDNSVEDIAATLGYAGASPFIRAFRQWSGSTPMAWRNGSGRPPG